MRRLALLFVGGAVWLFLAAIPVFADGGPHSMAVNNGSTGINADSCAWCHRAHSSQSPTGFLLTQPQPTVDEFCRSCHGAAGTGASTDVETGIQYGLTGVTRNTGTTIGALRGGGFLQARIGSDAGYRLVTNTGGTSSGKVPAAINNPRNVTSAHVAIGGAGGNGITAQLTVWGMGGVASNNPGPTLSTALGCTDCHNPHGNGNYRILNGKPSPADITTGSTYYPANAINVIDSPYASGKTKNYTVIQVKGSESTAATLDPTTNTVSPAVASTFLLYADQVLAARGSGTFNGIAGDYSVSSGDYLHLQWPYDATTGTQYDNPNGFPWTASASFTTGDQGVKWTSMDKIGFNMQMDAWCAQCHTRYLTPMGTSGNPSANSGDGIFMYRHTTFRKDRACTSCHVAHGTNAVMNTDPSAGTTYSANVPYPGATTATAVGDSRLLKVNNRGTCEMCHDPTQGSAATKAGVSPLGQGPTPLYRP